MRRSGRSIGPSPSSSSSSSFAGETFPLAPVEGDGIRLLLPSPLRPPPPHPVAVAVVASHGYLVFPASITADGGGPMDTLAFLQDDVSLPPRLSK